MAEKKDSNFDFLLSYSSIDDNGDSRLHTADLHSSPFHRDDNVMSEDLSSGRTSPIRVRTMKEYDQQIADLQKENFNLKLRIYFLEENARKYHNGEDQDIYQINIELKVEVEGLKKDLMDKQELLKKASSALESIMTTHESEMMALKESEMMKRNAEKEEMMMKVRAMQQLLDEKDKDCKELESELSAIDGRLRELTQKYDDLKVENESLKCDNERMKALDEKIKELEESLQQQQESLQQQQQQHSTNVDDNKSANDADHDDSKLLTKPTSLTSSSSSSSPSHCPPPPSPSLQSSSSSPKHHNHPLSSSSLLLVVSSNNNNANDGVDDLGKQKSQFESELNSKDKIIEQLRCALKVKEVIIEQLESENNEVKSKLKGHPTNDGIDVDVCNNLKPLGKIQSKVGYGRMADCNGNKHINDDGDDCDDNDISYDDDSRDEEKYLLESYVEKLSNKLKDKEDVIKDREKTIGYLREQLEKYNTVDGNHDENNDGNMEGISSSWSNLCKPSGIDGDSDKHHHYYDDHSDNDDDHDDNGAKFESSQYRNDRVMSDMSYLQIRNLGEILNCDKDGNNLDIADGMEKLRRENEDLKERIWVMEMNFGEWREVEKRGFIENAEGMKREIKKLLMQKDELESQLFDMQVKMDHVQQTCQDFNCENGDLQEKVTFLESILTAKTEENNGLVDRLKISEETIDDLKNKLMKKNEEISLKADDLTTLESKYNNLLAEQETLSLKINNMDCLIKKLESDLAEKSANEALMIEKLSISDALGQQLNCLLKEGSEINRDLSHRIEVLTEKSNELISSIHQKDELINGLNAQLDELKRDRDVLKGSSNVDEVDARSSSNSRMKKVELMSDNLEVESADQKNKLIGQWSDLISNMEEDWLREASDLKAWKEKLHSLALQIECLTCEKETMEIKFNKELHHKDFEIENLKKEISHLKGIVNNCGLPGNAITSNTNGMGFAVASGSSNGKGGSTQSIVDGAGNIFKTSMNSKTANKNKTYDNNDDDHNFSNLSLASGKSKEILDGARHITPDVSPPFCIMTSDDCKSLKRFDDTKQADFISSLTTAIENVLPRDNIKLGMMSKDEILKWVEGRRDEVLEFIKNGDVFKSYREDVNVSDARSGAKNSKFYLNYLSMHNDLDSKSAEHAHHDDNEKVEAMRKELDAVKHDLVKSNELVDLLTEQIKLNSGPNQSKDSKKRRSKDNFNTELIVKLVAEIKSLKQRLAEFQPHSDSIHQKDWTSKDNSSGTCPPTTDYHSMSPSANQDNNEPSLIKDQLKLSDYHKQLHLSNITAYDSRNNTGRISDLLKKGNENCNDRSISSSIKVNFTPHLEQSFRDLDSELNRLSLMPDMDSTRLDCTNMNKDYDASRKISGDHQLLANMLAVSEHRCRLMRDRLEEIVVFLKKLLDNPNISSSLLGMSGDVSKMSQCLNETASLLDDVSVWIEEGQDVLNQTSGAINSSFNNNRSSIIGRQSLINRSSLLGVVKERNDENDEEQVVAVAVENDKLQQKHYSNDDGRVFIEQYRVEISELKEKIESINKEKVEITERCKQITTESSNASHQYQLEISELKELVDSLKQHILDITEKYEISCVKQYQTEIMQLKDKISAMNISNAEITENYERIRMEALTNQKSADTLSCTLTACQHRLNEVEAELNNFKLERESLLSTKDQLEKENNELTEARKADSAMKNDQFAKLKAVLVELSTKLQENENEIENYHHQIKMLSNENIDLKEKLKVMDVCIEQLKIEKEYIHDKWIISEGQLNDLIGKENINSTNTSTTTTSMTTTTMTSATTVPVQHIITRTLFEHEQQSHNVADSTSNNQINNSCNIQEHRNLELEIRMLLEERDALSRKVYDLSKNKSFINNECLKLHVTSENSPKVSNDLQQQTCDHSSFIKEIDRLKRHYAELKARHSKCPTSQASASAGKNSKDADKMIKGKISQSEVIEQINKTRKILAQTTMNLDLAHQSEKISPSKSSDPIG